MAGIHELRQRNSTAAAIAEARQALGERLSISDAVRAQHGKDLTWDPGAPPDAVAFVEDVACNELGGFPGDRRHYMRVKIERDPNRRMTQTLRNDLGVDASL